MEHILLMLLSDYNGNPQLLKELLPSRARVHSAKNVFLSFNPSPQALIFYR